MFEKFIAFLKAPALFKIPYWIIVLLGAIYFLYVMGFDETENTFGIRLASFLVVVLISFWMWNRAQNKKTS